MATLTQTAMWAVFYLTETRSIHGLSDQAIYLFENRQAAEDFVFDKLVESGLIVEDDGKFLVDGLTCDSKECAVYEFQMNGGTCDYFDVYEVIDKRNFTPGARK